MSKHKTTIEELKMRIIAIDEFKKLVNGEGWTHEQHHEIETRIERVVEEYNDDAGVLIEKKIPNAMGWASISSKLGDIEVVYTELFSYDAGVEGSLDVSEVSYKPELYGVLVVGEAGDEYDGFDTDDFLPEVFTKIDYSKIEFN